VGVGFGWVGGLGELVRRSSHCKLDVCVLDLEEMDRRLILPKAGVQGYQGGLRHPVCWCGSGCLLVTQPCSLNPCACKLPTALTAQPRLMLTSCCCCRCRFCCCLPRGHFVATGGAGGELRVWDSASREIASHMKHHTMPITDLKVGRVVIAAGWRAC
jgi:hypothetical protein